MNEIGLDPGIDHLSAMKLIDEVQSHGGKVCVLIISMALRGKSHQKPGQTIFYY